MRYQSTCETEFQDHPLWLTNSAADVSTERRCGLQGLDLWMGAGASGCLQDMLSGLTRKRDRQINHREHRHNMTGRHRLIGGVRSYSAAVKVDLKTAYGTSYLNDGLQFSRNTTQRL